MIDRRYDFHGVEIAVAAADEALAEAVEGRLRHFGNRPSGPADVRFEFTFGAQENGNRPQRPAGPGRAVYEPPAGEVSYFDDSDTLYVEYSGVRVLCELELCRARVSVSDETRGDLWLLSRPMLTLPLVELLKRHGLFSVHAAGVELDGRGVLIAGASGSGKSTLALALLREGFGFLGDDMLFLHRDGEGVRVLAFPDEIDLSEHAAAFFPELSDLAQRRPPTGWPKHRLRAEITYAAGFVPECRPGLLVFPHVSEAPESVLEPLSEEEALLELAPNVLLTDGAASQAHLDALGRLAAASDCYRLETARDFRRIAALLRDLLT